jgi:hypothetical protein
MTNNSKMLIMPNMMLPMMLASPMSGSILEMLLKDRELVSIK